MKKLNFQLSNKGIDDLIKYLENYKKELNEKCEILCRKLCELGISVIDAKIVSGNGDSDTSHSTEIYIESDGQITNARLTLSGEDILFIEFGAGIYYNNGNVHPKASELGYGVGTYPGQTHAIVPGYWWYTEDGLKHFSRGTEATMPMYNASLEMIKNIETVAREVFNG